MHTSELASVQNCILEYLLFGSWVALFRSNVLCKNNTANNLELKNQTAWIRNAWTPSKIILPLFVLLTKYEMFSKWRSHSGIQIWPQIFQCSQRILIKVTFFISQIKSSGHIPIIKIFPRVLRWFSWRQFSLSQVWVQRFPTWLYGFLRPW